MSAHPQAAQHDGHGTHHDAHDAHDDQHDADGASPSTLGGYATGFILSVMLTAIPFWLVLGKVTPSSTVTAGLLLGFAAVQIVVHMVYFLHMNARSQGGWTLLALVFTVLLVVITLSGSIWVMYHLDTNMMPPMPSMSMP